MFAAYQVVTLIVAPILGDTLPRIGRRRAIFIGVIAIPIATSLFAFAALFEDDVVFYVVSVLARCFQGAADAFIMVSVPSIISLEWPEQDEVYQGYVGMSMGIGLMLGPVISSITVRFFEYFWTLIFFAVLVFVLTFTAACMIPKRIDTNTDSKGEVDDIPYSLFLKNPRVITVLLVSFVSSLCLIFMDPILVLRLE